MRSSLCAVVALACTAGCVLDFTDFHGARMTADASVDADAGFDGGPDVVDATVDEPAASDDVPASDHPVETDLGDPRCVPPPNAVIRVAHMAAGVGAVDLCMRRHGSEAPFARVASNEWPAAGVGYAMVSQHVSLNSQVASANDRWQFALVPRGADCAAATALAGALATLTVNVDPQSQSTLLLTSEWGADGRIIGVLGLLSDPRCTTCPGNTLDVRAVHASLGASRDRISLSINYSVPPPGPVPFVNVLFASNIPYGQTAPVGGAGFDCDPAWRGAADLPPSFSVQLAAQAVSEDVIARSDRVGLKGDLLQRSRMATVFFVGGDGVRTSGPEFVLCYEGIRDAGMTVCDRIPATTVPRPAATDGGVAADAGDARSDPGDGATEGDVLL